MEMEKRFLEISQATNPNGRRRVKIVLHEIYPDNTRWNINGISYLEQYTRDNADTVKGIWWCEMVLCCLQDIHWICFKPVFEKTIRKL